MVLAMNARAMGLLLAAGCAAAPPRPAPPPEAPLWAHARTPDAIEALVVHPVLPLAFMVLEHYADQLPALGDALGADCVAVRIVEEDGRTWSRSHRGDGHQNEDWYGWRQPVLAPIAGEVVQLHQNPKVNAPGTLTQDFASFVIIRRDDGVHVLVAHLQELKVNVGDHVVAGQPLGVVGNNGSSRHPHVHVGAWRGDVPLQLRFDQHAMGALMQRAAPQKATP
jgi:murein DD-endopeptidase MepM/ murein hydrolase activator NlpD